MLQAEAGRPDDDRPNEKEYDGRAKVGLQENQGCRQRHMQQRAQHGRNAVEALEAIRQVLRQRNNQQDFANLRRLNANADIEPALSAARAFHAEAQHQHQQDRHQAIQPGTDAAKLPIIQRRHNRDAREADDGVGDLIGYAPDDFVVDGVLRRAGDHEDAEDDQCGRGCQQHDINPSPYIPRAHGNSPNRSGLSANYSEVGNARQGKH